jgi:cyclic pyranopterin phosphate synthase
MEVAIVLLTGGEPFARKDLSEIIYAFESRGIHVRMQTNGFASEEQIAKAVEAGGRDISISLDSLNPERQDNINGDFHKLHNELYKINLK